MAVKDKRLVELRRFAAAQGACVGEVADEVLEELLQRVGDVELASDVLAMRPRPAWAVELLGAQPE